MGPPPNNCRQAIHSSLLERNEKVIGFEPGPRVRFCPPPGMTHVEYARQLVEQCGGGNVEEIRRRLPLPRGRLACVYLDGPPRQEPPEAGPLDDLSPPERALWPAILLGLCNLHFYDENRPVILTNGRLKRNVLLFAPRESFYAD